MENPLQSKGRNSLTACYLYVMNLETHHRSRTTTMLTVQVFYTADLDHFQFNEIFMRMVEDINRLIQTGLTCALHKQPYPVRFCQWRGDNKERHIILNLGNNGGNFSTTRFFSSYTYVDQNARKSALSVEDLLPQKFGIRDRESYQRDLLALETGCGDSHNQKGDSIVNTIVHFHAIDNGSLPACIHHDAYAGFLRTDMARVVKTAFKKNVVKPAVFVRKCFQFKKKLNGTDKSSWMPKLRTDSFDSKLAGKMAQNAKFIMWLSVLMKEDLESKQGQIFISSDEWKLYLIAKKLSEYILAEKLSERQVNEMEVIIHAYTDVRIRLHQQCVDKNTASSQPKVDSKSTPKASTSKVGNKKKTIPIKKGKSVSGKASAKVLAPRVSKVRKKKNFWGPVSPKNVFLLSYPDMIREVGALANYSTIRFEGKNGVVKRMAKLANNTKNIVATIIRQENEFIAAATHRGIFSESRLAIASSEKVPKDSDVDSFIEEAFGANWKNRFLSADDITYKGTKYSNQSNHSVLLHQQNQTEFGVGVIRKIIIPNNESFNTVVPLVVYQETEKQVVENLGVYQIEMKDSFSFVSIEALAHYFPLYLFQTENTEDLFLTLKCQPYLV